MAAMGTAAKASLISYRSTSWGDHFSWGEQLLDRADRRQREPFRLAREAGRNPRFLQGGFKPLAAAERLTHQHHGRGAIGNSR